MLKLFNKDYHSPGTPPGTLASDTIDDSAPLNFLTLDYSEDSLVEIDNALPSDIEAKLESNTATWFQVQGSPNADWMQQYGSLFKLHPLVQEDILNGGQRPKLESYDDQLFIVMNLPDDVDGVITINQLYLCWHKHYLISFYTGDKDTFSPLLKRLRTSGTRSRRSGLDYLVYLIMDLAIDQAFPVLETLGLGLETLEEKLLQEPDQSVLHEIHEAKRHIILLRRGIWPQREVLNQLIRDENAWVEDPTQVYLRDCYDHTIQVMDLLESYRDMSASLLDLYLSSASMRMNEVMRLLTIFTTIFIPLTFIAGVYGMNFAGESQSPWAMPELRWSFGYPFVWGLFIVIAIGMLIFFRRKRWL